MTHPTNLIIIHAHAEGEEEEEEVSVRTMPGAAVAIISSRRKKRAPSLFNPFFILIAVAYNLGVLAVCVFTLTQQAGAVITVVNAPQRKNRSLTTPDHITRVVTIMQI